MKVVDLKNSLNSQEIACGEFQFSLNLQVEKFLKIYKKTPVPESRFKKTGN